MARHTRWVGGRNTFTQAGLIDLAQRLRAGQAPRGTDRPRLHAAQQALLDMATALREYEVRRAVDCAVKCLRYVG